MTSWTCPECRTDVLEAPAVDASEVERLLQRYGGHIESECRTAHDGSPCTCGWVDVLQLVLAQSGGPA